jgi:Skp family chaperone for outer membrane proteins
MVHAEVPLNYALRLLLLCAVLASFSANAESVLDVIPTLDSIASRLELSPEQETRLRPIFQKRMSELQASQVLLQRADTAQQKDEVLRDAKKAGDEFNSQVESVLTPSQKHEWHEIRSGLHEKVKERTDQ